MKTSWLCCVGIAACAAEEPTDCKWGAVRCGSRCHTDRLLLSLLIYVERLAITEMISGRIQMHVI